MQTYSFADLLAARERFFRRVVCVIGTVVAQCLDKLHPIKCVVSANCKPLLLCCFALYTVFNYCITCQIVRSVVPGYPASSGSLVADSTVLCTVFRAHVIPQLYSLNFIARVNIGKYAVQHS